MEQYKEHDIVLLPTKEKSNIIVNHNRLTYFKVNPIGITQDTSPRHLYITSDEEIKEGNWCYRTDIKEIFKAGATSSFYIGCANTGGISRQVCKKIIVTTDKSLKLGTCDSCTTDKDYRHNFSVCKCKLPQIPQQFIEHYINESNKGNVIDKVLVEYEYNEDRIVNNKDIGDYSLVINTDNTINIKLIEESKLYTEKQVISLLKEYREHAWIHGSTLHTLTNWIIDKFK